MIITFPYRALLTVLKSESYAQGLYHDAITHRAQWRVTFSSADSSGQNRLFLLTRWIPLFIASRCWLLIYFWLIFDYFLPLWMIFIPLEDCIALLQSSLNVISYCSEVFVPLWIRILSQLFIILLNSYSLATRYCVVRAWGRILW
jgi:hypothetical protein